VHDRTWGRIAAVCAREAACMSWAKLKRDRTWGRIAAVSVRISAQGYAGPRLIVRRPEAMIFLLGSTSALPLPSGLSVGLLISCSFARGCARPPARWDISCVFRIDPPRSTLQARSEPPQEIGGENEVSRRRARQSLGDSREEFVRVQVPIGDCLQRCADYVDGSRH
jgi:hypothetical protein